MTDAHVIELVAKLSEQYQPIYGHPEFSINSERACNDRLADVIAIHDALFNKLNRPVRVLDLGCSLGYFSFSLAARGAECYGVEYFKPNFDVCMALRDEFSSLNISFTMECIENIIFSLKPEQYDLVIGLSVFHHSIHAHGLNYVQHLMEKLATTIPVCVFELALKNEPMYWADSLPENPLEAIDKFSFVQEINCYDTHLSNVKRPLYFASNYWWYLSGQLEFFDSWKSSSHFLEKNAHQGTRSYYFGGQFVAKVFSFEVENQRINNLDEYYNEINFLLNPPQGFIAPALVLHGKNDKCGWLVRHYMQGSLLLDLMEKGIVYNAEQIISDVLNQLVLLEAIGLYHNDVRTWNILISPQGNANLLDYGAITFKKEDCVWPNNLFLAFIIFVREVLQRKTASSNPLRQPLFDLQALSANYCHGFNAFLALPECDWCFSLLRECLNQTSQLAVLATPTKNDGMVILLKKMEEAISIYADLTRVWQAAHQEIEKKYTLLSSENEVLRVQLNQLYQQIEHEKERSSLLLNEMGALQNVLERTQDTLFDVQAKYYSLQDIHTTSLVSLNQSQERVLSLQEMQMQCQKNTSDMIHIKLEQLQQCVDEHHQNFLEHSQNTLLDAEVKYHLLQDVHTTSLRSLNQSQERVLSLQEIQIQCQKNTSDMIHIKLEQLQQSVDEHQVESKLIRYAQRLTDN